MNKVKAWCVKDHNGVLHEDTCSQMEGVAATKYCLDKNISQSAWRLLQESGHSVVQVEIKEVSNET